MLNISFVISLPNLISNYNLVGSTLYITSIVSYLNVLCVLCTQQSEAPLPRDCRGLALLGFPKTAGWSGQVRAGAKVSSDKLTG